NYTQTAAGALGIKLAGTTPGTGFDQMNVSGTAAVDGTLNVNVAGGFAFDSGTTFPVLTFGSRSGQFAATAGLNAGNGQSLRVVYGPTDVTLVGVRTGVRVTSTSGLVTTEAGGTAQFTVVLSARPAADVTVGLSSSKPAAGTVAPAGLTFTPDNWDMPRAVTVTGQPVGVLTGDTPFAILLAPAVT